PWQVKQFAARIGWTSRANWILRVGAFWSGPAGGLVPPPQARPAGRTTPPSTRQRFMAPALSRALGEVRAAGGPPFAAAPENPPAAHWLTQLRQGSCTRTLIRNYSQAARFRGQGQGLWARQDNRQARLAAGCRLIVSQTPVRGKNIFAAGNIFPPWVR